MIQGLAPHTRTPGIAMRGYVKFDKSRVVTSVETANKRYLFRAGAFTRGGAKRLIRFRKDSGNASLAGTPPHTHGDRKLKRSVAYAVDQPGGNVIIGPAASWIGKLGALHEFGGVRVVKTPPVGFQGTQRYKKGDIGPVSTGKFSAYKTSSTHGYKDADGSAVAFVQLRTVKQAEHAGRLRRRLARKYATRKTATYPARPFMGPALAEITPKLPAMWADSFH